MTTPDRDPTCLDRQTRLLKEVMKAAILLFPRDQWDRLFGRAEKVLKESLRMQEAVLKVMDETDDYDLWRTLRKAVYGHCGHTVPDRFVETYEERKEALFRSEPDVVPSTEEGK